MSAPHYAFTFMWFMGRMDGNVTSGYLGMKCRLIEKQKIAQILRFIFLSSEIRERDLSAFQGHVSLP
jgi:hypothetical protein